jgi:hypothetical protein
MLNIQVMVLGNEGPLLELTPSEAAWRLYLYGRGFAILVLNPVLNLCIPGDLKGLSFFTLRVRP